MEVCIRSKQPWYLAWKMGGGGGGSNFLLGVGGSPLPPPPPPPLSSLPRTTQTHTHTHNKITRKEKNLHSNETKHSLPTPLPPLPPFFFLLFSFFSFPSPLSHYCSITWNLIHTPKTSVFLGPGRFILLEKLYTPLISC